MPWLLNYILLSKTWLKMSSSQISLRIKKWTYWHLTLQYFSGIFPLEVSLGPAKCLNPCCTHTFSLVLHRHRLQQLPLSFSQVWGYKVLSQCWPSSQLRDCLESLEFRQTWGKPQQWETRCDLTARPRQAHLQGDSRLFPAHSTSAGWGTSRLLSSDTSLNLGLW